MFWYFLWSTDEVDWLVVKYSGNTGYLSEENKMPCCYINSCLSCWSIVFFYCRICFQEKYRKWRRHLWRMMSERFILKMILVLDIKLFKKPLLLETIKMVRIHPFPDEFFQLYFAVNFWNFLDFHISIEIPQIFFFLKIFSRCYVEFVIGKQLRGVRRRRCICRSNFNG